MFKENIALYLGEEKDKGFSGFVAEEHFFLVLDCEDGLDYTKGHQILTSIRDAIRTAKIAGLHDFEVFINSQLVKENIPITASIASGYIVDSVVYMKTSNQGEIFVMRSGKYERLIEKDNSASGYLKEGDYFVFTTRSFSQLIEKEKDMQGILAKKSPHEVVDELVPMLKSTSDKGMVAVFVQISKDVNSAFEEQPLFKSYRYPFEPFIERVRMLRQKLFLNSPPRSKKITFIVLLVIVALLVWSVGLASKRRRADYEQKKIKQASEVIDAKLNQAEEVAFFNLQRSLILISEAKSELEGLKRELPNSKSADIKKLEDQVSEKEKNITKKEEKNFEEFFDLAVDEKSAKGEKLYRNEDKLAILNISGGTVYTLSLAQKSLERISVPELTHASYIALYQDKLYFFVRDRGIYLLEDGKARRVVDLDSDWGEIKQMIVYNGNIYLLDSAKGTIYKYLVAEDGFSEKQSYFGSTDEGNLKNAQSMSIDASVYISYDDVIQKYTAGAQDGFSTSYPSVDINITKVLTDKDLEKVYAWDKAHQSLYILGKNGTYEREIKSKAFGQASDLSIYEDGAYLLVGAKILRVPLD